MPVEATQEEVQEEVTQEKQELEGGGATAGKKKVKKDLKRFVVVSNLPVKRKDLVRTDYVFMNSQPRGAALKAANRGVQKVYLYETHTNKVHVETYAVSGYPLGR